MTWKDANCGAALFNVNSGNLEDRMNQLSEMSDNMFGDITEYAADLGLQIAQERLEHYALATGGRYLATGLCGPGALICGAAATALTVASGVWNLFSGGREIIRAGRQVDEMLDTISRVRNNSQAVLNAAEDPAALRRVQTELAEAMALAAEADPCLKARKCYLTPYRPANRNRPQGPSSMNQAGPGGTGFFDAGFADLSDSRGCCPGQTGHHLLPEAFFDNCPAYNSATHNQAPTVCAEGVNNAQGSHGQLHAAMDDRLETDHGEGQPMSMDQAMDHAVESMKETVGDNCREECLREQLERFYKDLQCQPEPRLSRGQAPGQGASPGVDSGDD